AGLGRMLGCAWSGPSTGQPQAAWAGMSISFGVAAAAALVALVFTGMLVHRCARTPRLDLAAGVCAGLGLTAALGAQAAGYRQGFTPATSGASHPGARL